jgi:MFS family permease
LGTVPARKIFDSSIVNHEFGTLDSISKPPAGPRHVNERPFSVLRQGSLTRFWLARVATAVALQMQGVAVGWQLYDLTSNPIDLGLVGLVQFVPVVLLLLVSGQVADRYDRRVVLALSQIVEAAGALVLTLATLLGAIESWVIFATVFVLGAARSFEMTTSQTLLPGIVPAAVLPRAIAVIASSTQAATIAGPALGGLLYILGPSYVYITCCALSLSATLLVLGVRTERAVAKREPVSTAGLFAGIDFIRKNPIVLGALSLDLFAVLLGGATALLPIFARDIFAVGPWGLGLLRASPAVGALAISLALMRRPLRARVGRSMFAAVAAFGIATIVFAWSSSLVLTMAALAVLGASDMFSIVIRQTLVQLETPDAMRGRVSAVNTLFVGTANRLGDFRAGLTAAWFGTVPAVLIGGLGILLVAAIWIRTFPALYRVERFQAHERVPS